jgi:Secretion system C-terminal sorting domain
MKQLFLSAGSLLLLASTGFAQSRTATPAMKNTEVQTIAQEPVLNGGQNQLPPRQTPHRNNGTNTTNVISQIDMGTAINAFTGVDNDKNTFSYNPELNLLVFGHRGGGLAGTPPAPTNTPGNTGNQFHYDYSTDRGQTWTSQVALINPAIATYWTRYPQAGIFNPAGNTNLANAKVVSTGLIVTNVANAPAGWLGTFLASANVQGASNTNYSFRRNLPAATGSEQREYISSSLSNLTGGMGYLSIRIDSVASIAPGGTATTQRLRYGRHILDFWKIVPNGTGFTRSLKFTSAPNACAIVDTTAFAYDLAFAPDGNTGYISHVTGDIDTQNPESYSRTPILYKTTDAGETWIKQPNIDVRAIQVLLDSTTKARGGSIRPIFTESDIAVDNLGRCHIFANIGSGSTVCNDSIGFIFGANDARAYYTVHLIVDGSNVSAKFVYQPICTDITFGSGTASVGNGFNAQAQVGRSADGTRIFFTALQSSPLVTPPSNNAPDLWAYAYRTTDNKVMPFRNLTVGSDAEASVFFARLAPVAINIAGGHQLPITVMTPMTDANNVVQASLPVTFTFLDGVEILDADYTQTMAAAAPAVYPNSVNTCGGNINICIVSTENRSALEGKVSFMPNPTSGNLTVNLSQLSAAATITVSDALGKVISTQTNQTGTTVLDLTAQAAGIYFVTVQNTEGTLTAKIAVTK